MYVVPSDGEDRGLDTTAVLVNTVGSFQNWLGAQTGGRKLRIDTHDGGALDITFRRLARTDAAMQGYGVFIRDTLEKDLAGMGFASTTKIYAVYYDGGAINSCGAGAWPPQLPGRVGAMYLRGTFTGGAPPCSSNPLAPTPTSPPGYMDFSMLHEILHTMGIVSPTAPDHVPNAHVGNSPTDLMYAGNQPWAPAVLDVTGTNYYNPAGLPGGLYNLATSPYLLP